MARDLRAKQSSSDVSAEHTMYISDQIAFEVIENKAYAVLVDYKIDSLFTTLW